MTLRINEHLFHDAENKDALCQRCGVLTYKEAAAWATRCRGPARKPTPEPESAATPAYGWAYPQGVCL